MGNYVSCALSSTPFGKSSSSSNATTVILPRGEIRQFKEPIKAAELMLETPNFFVVNAQSLNPGRRFCPLNADEDLELANVYVMVPMKRVNCSVTAADMGALFIAANSASKKGIFGGGEARRILPEAAEEANLRDVSSEINEEKRTLMQPKLNLDDIEEFSSPDFMYRVSMSRSKKPLLETIAEETICARIWWPRNEHLWNNIDVPAGIIMNQALDYLYEWQMAQANLRHPYSNAPGAPQAVPLVAAEAGDAWISQVDAAIFEQQQCIGQPTIIPSNEGNFMHAITSTRQGFYSPRVAEALALRCSLEFAVSNCHGPEIVLTDNQALVDTVSGSNEDSPEYGTIVEECRHLCLYVRTSNLLE